MFKKALLTLSAIALVLAVYFLARPQENKKGDQVLGLPTANPQRDFAWAEIKDLDGLTLIPNFATKRSAGSVFRDEECRLLTSAGFYDPSDQPIGLFVTDGVTQNPFQKNILFNGVLSVNFAATPRITRTPPADPLRLAVQSGPVLIENSFPQKLKLKSDSPSRRVVAAITGDNSLLFIIFFDPESQFQGPLLADLPNRLGQFSAETGIALADAINLDGGTASAFYTPDFSLSEASPVGAFFCLK